MNYLKLLPEYPRTRHLPYKPNAQRLDLIASEEEAKVIFENENTFVEDKMDGANCGICFFENNPVIRNRSNILSKAKSGHLRTPAKIQFAPLWNFCYENREKFDKLNNLAGFDVSVYGEWLYALHGIRYNVLPTYFMAFDLYDWEKGYFIETGSARRLLDEAGFRVVPLLYKGKVESYEFLEKFMGEKSEFSDLDKREGIYVKVSDQEKVISRFKWVRHDFIQGCRWDARQITKNKLKTF
jgi:atypical dual specificity phosphatase